MSQAEQLKELVDHGGDLIAFLKTLNKKEGKALLPVLSELREKYNKSKTVVKTDRQGRKHKTSYGFIYPDIHRERIQKAGLVCADTITQYRNNINWGPEQIVLRDDVIEEILPWHIPKWFNRSINRVVNWWILDYEKLLILINKGFLKANDELIAGVFVFSSCVITRGEGKERKQTYTYNILNSDPLALDKHFWLIFEQQTAINSKWHVPEENDWLKIIPDLINKGMIDRQRVISQALLSCTKGFNKSLSGWYYKLLKTLKITDKELLSHQDNLMVCLNSDVSPAIKFGLECAKKLVNLEDFKRTGFMDLAPTLLSSSTKSTVNSTLIVLEKIIKKDPKSQIPIARIMVDLLSFADEKIQLRAAKTIKKYLPINEENILLVSSFNTEIFTSVKEVLNEYILDIDSELTFMEETEELSLQQDVLREENKIKFPETIEDIIFYLSKIIDTKDYKDYLILPNVVLKLDSIVTSENANKLSPAFNRNFRYQNPWHNRAGIFHLISAYLNDYAKDIDIRFSNVLTGRKDYIEKQIRDYEPRKQMNELSFKDMKVNFTLRIIKIMWLKSQKIREKGLSLLSTPTHTPCWIAPIILVKRILEYESADEKINLPDFQVACLRIPLTYEPIEEFTQLLSKIKNPIIHSVLSYLIVEKEIEIFEINNNISAQCFLPAILAIQDKKGKQLISSHISNIDFVIHDLNWKIGSMDYIANEWDYKNRSYKKVLKSKDVLHIVEYVDNVKEKTDNSGLFNRLKKTFFGKSSTINNPPNLFDLYSYKSMDYGHVKYINSYYSFIGNGDSKFNLSLIPNHYHLYLSQLVQGTLTQSNLEGEISRNAVINAVEFLNETWHRKEEHELTYLFMAAGFLCDNRIAKEALAEWWITYTESDLIDQKKLGTLLGKLLSNNYAPLKRLTDNMSNRMYNLNRTIDTALHTLISAMIPRMSDKPITNTKKLLGLFLELSVKHNLPIPSNNNEKLIIWNKTKSLGTIIKKLKKISVD